MKLIKFPCLLFLLVMLGMPPAALSDPFPPVEVSSREEILYNASISHDNASQMVEQSTLAQRTIRNEMPTRVEIVIEKKKIGDRNVIYYTRNEYLSNGNLAEWNFVLEVGKNLVMNSLKKKITTQSGLLVREEFINFRAPGLEYPNDILHAYVIEVALRGVDFHEGYKNKFPMYLTSINIINMDLKVVGKEKVKVPSGIYECWKVEMRPHLEDWVGRVAANLLRSFTPNYVFWFNTGTGHHLVKYEGILGAIGAPVLKLELVSRVCCRFAK